MQWLRHWTLEVQGMTLLLHCFLGQQTLCRDLLSVSIQMNKWVKVALCWGVTLRLTDVSNPGSGVGGNDSLSYIMVLKTGVGPWGLMCHGFYGKLRLQKFCFQELPPKFINKE